jgi:hypothetical protein
LVRVFGWAEQPAACAVEADHLHNLPDLLRRFKPDLLAFYLRTTRETYLAQESETLVVYAPLWHELEAELAKLTAA